MSTSVTHRLTISGNQQVKNFIKNLNQQFIQDEEVNGFRNSTSIRRLIYGYSAQVAQSILSDEDAKRIYFLDESDWRSIESCISFSSDGCTIENLEDYLLVLVSHLDPKVLICNQYQDEYLTECNTRYSLMRDLAPVEIKTSTPIPASQNQNQAFFNRIERLVLKDKENAFKLVKKSYRWIADDMYL